MPTPTQKNTEDIASLDTKLDSLDTKVIALDTKVVSLDTKVIALDTKVVSLDTKFNSFETNFNVFRSVTDQSLRLIKYIGGPILLFVFATGIKLISDVAKAEGRIEGQSGRLDRIEKSLERLTDAVLKNVASSRPPDADALGRRVDAAVGRISPTDRYYFVLHDKDLVPPVGHTASQADGNSLVLFVKLESMPPQNESESEAMNARRLWGYVTFSPRLPDKLSPFRPTAVFAYVSAIKNGMATIEARFSETPPKEAFLAAIDRKLHPEGVRGFVTIEH